MTKRLVIASGAWGLGLLAVLFFAVAVRAATVHAYLYLQGIRGESTEANHKDWIEISSFQWSALEQEAENEKAGRAVAHRSLVITKPWGAASPKLKEACATGKYFPSVEIDVVSEGQTRHYHLSKVTVASFRSSGGDRPTEVIALSFERITIN